MLFTNLPKLCHWWRHMRYVPQAIERYPGTFSTVHVQFKMLFASCSYKWFLVSSCGLNTTHFGLVWKLGALYLVNSYSDMACWVILRTGSGCFLKLSTSSIITESIECVFSNCLLQPNLLKE